ncbi:MAG: (d)CMP kinase [Gemmatimonadota bacterium]
MSRGRAITIAIDGPAAAGKSTTARAVADRLGYAHLNSGQMYRAITWAAVREGWIDATDFEARLSELDIEARRDVPGFRILVRGVDPGEGMTGEATAARVSEVAARSSVRAKVLRILRERGGGGGVVCDGRDIGTVVFPDAELKVFLVASPQERARRRLRERDMSPSARDVAEEEERLRARDRADASRELAPLSKAPDAEEIDTTGVSPEEVVARIVALARHRMDRPG